MASFEFEKFYSVGKHLQNHSNSEEYQRSSITRYYYSVFHASKEYYEKSFRKILSPEHAHSTLISEFEKSPFEKENELGEKLRVLKNNRVHADYRKRKLTTNQTKNSKKISEEIFALLDYLINHPVRIMKD